MRDCLIFLNFVMLSFWLLALKVAADGESIFGCILFLLFATTSSFTILAL
jgi:hypothetical protein